VKDLDCRRDGAELEGEDVDGFEHRGEGQVAEALVEEVTYFVREGLVKLGPVEVDGHGRRRDG
jgi:hypothetical protein